MPAPQHARKMVSQMLFAGPPSFFNRQLRVTSRQELTELCGKHPDKVHIACRTGAARRRFAAGAIGHFPTSADRLMLRDSRQPFGSLKDRRRTSADGEGSPLILRLQSSSVRHNVQVSDADQARCDALSHIPVNSTQARILRERGSSNRKLNRGRDWRICAGTTGRVQRTGSVRRLTADGRLKPGLRPGSRSARGCGIRSRQSADSRRGRSVRPCAGPVRCRIQPVSPSPSPPVLHGNNGVRTH